MRRLKRRSKVTLSILLLCIILFFFWVNMNPCGDWIIKADEVEAEWFDYTWRSHSYVLSDEQKTEINEKIKLACKWRVAVVLVADRAGRRSKLSLKLLW